MGTIVHVRVDKVRLRNCTGGPEPNKFEHMPFTRDAIERSVTHMVKQGRVPEFQGRIRRVAEGLWRRLHDYCGREAITVGEETFRKESWLRFRLTQKQLGQTLFCGTHATYFANKRRWDSRGKGCACWLRRLRDSRM